MPIDFTKSKYSPKARKFLSKSPLDFPLLTLLCGSVRSGKTINIVYKIPQYFAEIGNEYLKVFSGFSKNTVRNNVLIELIPYLENYHGAKVRYNSSSGEMDVKLWGKNYSCLVVGAGKADSYASIQGGTWDFWYANELPQHHYSFYNMALSRLTPEQARGVADANPESTNHWLYTEKIRPFLQKEEEIIKVFEYWHFTMDDNANLSNTFIENQKRLYSGAFYERKILGQWVIAEGLVYDTFSLEKHTCTRDEVFEMIKQNKFHTYMVGIDFGWNDPCFVGLFGITSDNTYYLIDELYKKHIEADDISAWILDKQTEYQKYFRFGVADNSRPECIYRIQQKTGLLMYDDKPKIEDSIAIVRSVINFDRLIVNRDNCNFFLSEIQTYRYADENERLKSNINVELPIDKNNHAMDGSRYAISLYETKFKNINLK